MASALEYKSKRVLLQNKELATVLAALRFWQSKIGPDRLPAQANAVADFALFFENGNKYAPKDAMDKPEIDSLCERLNEGDGENFEAYRKAAKRMFQDEGTIEIDDGATVSAGDANGAYVEAWVWVPDDEING
jgi:hypothetical protein